MQLRRTCGWLVLLGFLLPLRIAHAAESRLVQPVENSVLRHREIQIIALLESSAPLDVTLSVDGRSLAFRVSPPKPPSRTTSLHAVTTVTGFGVHRISIFAQGKGGNPRLGKQQIFLWRKNVEFFVADPLASSIPKRFQDKPFHNDTNQKGCAGSTCHEFKLEKKVAVAVDTGCRTCHKRESEFRHAPVREGACAECHAAGTSGFAPRRTAEEACFGCHKDMKEAMAAAKFVHGPSQKMECTLCHDPHGERQRMETWRGRNETCVACHSGYDKTPHVIGGFANQSAGHPISVQMNPLSPSETLSCGACHNPHYANTPMHYGYLATERNQLCKMCHDDKF